MYILKIHYNTFKKFVGVRLDTSFEYIHSSVNF